MHAYETSIYSHAALGATPALYIANIGALKTKLYIGCLISMCSYNRDTFKVPSICGVNLHYILQLGS